MPPDKDIVSWMLRLGILEATGDKKFDSMLGSIASNSGNASTNTASDVHDQNKIANRVDTFIDRGIRDQESYKRPSNEKLIAVGDKIVNFLHAYVTKKFGSYRYDGSSPLPNVFFYTLRMLSTHEEFMDYISEFDISPSKIPRDIEKYAETDLVDWVCKSTGVTKEEFERIEDLCIEYTDGSLTDSLRFFPRNWFYGMLEYTLDDPWEEARDQLV